jgi:hypothetical protein
LESQRALTAGNKDETGWHRVEQMLGERPHTVFAGHVHYYAQYDRNGQKYYHLATTGGSSLLRGEPYGEFDEIAWLTMEKDGPTVANLVLDGILPGNVVTEESIARFRSFLAKTQIEVAPILIDDAGGLSQGRIDLRLVNGFDVPVEVSATIAGLPLRGLTVDPETLKLAAAPGQSDELAVNVHFAEKIAFEHLAQTVLTASLRTTEGDRPLTAERQVPVVIDRKYAIPRVAAIKVDGDLDDWPADWLPMPATPLVLDRPQDWIGPDDCGVSIQAAHDDDHLYLAARVTDERILAGDQLTFVIDTRSLTARRDDPRLRKGTLRVTVTPETGGVESVGLSGTPDPKTTDMQIAKRDRSYDIEVALPLDIIDAAQPDRQSIQLTAVVSDVDEAGQKPARVLWRGTSDVNDRNTNYGHFILAP